MHMSSTHSARFGKRLLTGIRLSPYSWKVKGDAKAAPYADLAAAAGEPAWNFHKYLVEEIAAIKHIIVYGQFVMAHEMYLHVPGHGLHCMS